MLQSFDAPTDPQQGPPRLRALRAELARRGLDGFLVPRADAHQGEYVAPRDERLAWLTGFTGSAGFAVVLPEAAGLFVDGRYGVQARAQVDTDHFTPIDWPATRPAAWLRDMLPGGGVIGFDPWLHGRDEIDKLQTALAGSDITLTRSANPIDAIWPDQPAPPCGRVRVHPEALAGESASHKRERLARGLADAGQRAAVITLPDSLCWLLNIRGSDIPRNPVVHGFALLHDDARVTLFIDEAKLDDAVRAHLGEAVTLRPPDALEASLRTQAGPVLLDSASAPLSLADELEEAGVAVAWGQDPCILPKACKTEAEIAGIRAAHLRDGAAMVEFLAWLDAEAPTGRLTEIDVVRRLEQARRDTGQLLDIAFDTIAGAGPHGAIVHYRVTGASNRALRPGELFLVDSGGQYPDGTTDVTRTIAVGDARDDQRAAFTRVLKGMIAISVTRFPEGVAGCHIDALARAPLWQAGQDFDHGTGHGVGAALSVHEGPQRLARSSDVALAQGMILSNEPGYYREDDFGIRLENLVVVRRAAPLEGGDAQRSMLDFETLTWVPIDRNLVDAHALDSAERAWLDAYHAEVRRRLSPLVTDAARAWLERVTGPL